MKSFDISLHIQKKSKEVLGNGEIKLQEIKETFNNYTETMRKKNFRPTAFILAACLFLGVFLSIHYYKSSFFYSVYIDGEEIGLVKDTAVVENMVSGLLQSSSQEHDLQVFSYEEISFSGPEYRFRGTERIGEIEHIINERLSYFSWGYLVFVDGKPIMHLESSKVLEELLENVKQRYAPISRGNKLIDISISENITGEWTRVAPDEIKSLGEAFLLFYPGNTDNRVYLASRGDTLHDIARSNNISIKELEEINPDLENQDLEEGQEIKVPAADSPVSIISVEEQKEKEEISYDTKYVFNDEMNSDESNLKTEGKPGLKEITIHITRINGQETERETVSEEIIKEPVDELIEQGTKKYTVAGTAGGGGVGSVTTGTGRFIWPVPHSYDGGGRITRGFTGGHSGVDIYAGTLTSTPIIAADSGTVVASQHYYAYGNIVVIYHGAYYTVYAHNSRNLAETGQSVEKGSVIAYMGNTGRTFGRTGIHLHFEIRDATNAGSWQQARPVNPMNFF